MRGEAIESIYAAALFMRKVELERNELRASTFPGCTEHMGDEDPHTASCLPAIWDPEPHGVNEWHDKESCPGCRNKAQAVRVKANVVKGARRRLRRLLDREVMR